MRRLVRPRATAAATEPEISRPRPCSSACARRARLAHLARRSHAFTTLHGEFLAGFVALLEAQLGERLVALSRADQVARSQRFQDRPRFILAAFELGQR